MPPQLAFLVCAGFVCWLFAWDFKRKPAVSRATWIPLLWMAVIGSRPVCLWFGIGLPSGDDGYTEGTPLDRAVYLSLIIAGLWVLVRRRVSLPAVAAANKWLTLFFLYWAISVFWSDYPFVSFKRWIKDLGFVIMVLIILTEEDPVDAAKAVFIRCAYLLIPLSVVYIKYFPDLGRELNRWTWEYMYVGVTMHKNGLGVLVLVSSLFLVWELLSALAAGVWRSQRKELLVPGAMLVMCGWLLYKANSATFLVCTVLGVSLLLAFRSKLLQERMHAIGIYGLVAAALLVALDAAFNIKEFIVTSLGRDLTLTTRTDLWKIVLQQDFNPLIGTGFYSFWTGRRLEAVWTKYEGLNQAHNGYLETYLNGGFIACFLLLGCILAAQIQIRRELLLGNDFAKMKFVLGVVCLVSNFTEASFDRLSLIWTVFLLSAVRPPYSASEVSVSPAAIPAWQHAEILEGSVGDPALLNKEASVSQ